ncbi:MAG: hypothetical protein HY327_04390 [Chloroflexi bacterium]|nr:hypothetical protein [Chloroflexota bacterium]
MRITLTEKNTERTLGGEIRPARIEDLELWLQWLPIMPPDAEDAHWEWDEFIAQGLEYRDELVAFSLLAENKLQGLMLLELESKDAEGNASIHVLRISTAPWNRSPNNRYRFAGSLLIAQAVKLGFELERDGRVWLESLPGAEGFYRGLGMIELREKSGEEKLTRFRFDPVTARVFLGRMQGRLER